MPNSDGSITTDVINQITEHPADKAARAAITLLTQPNRQMDPALYYARTYDKEAALIPRDQPIGTELNWITDLRDHAREAQAMGEMEAKAQTGKLTTQPDRIMDPLSNLLTMLDQVAASDNRGIVRGTESAIETNFGPHAVQQRESRVEQQQKMSPQDLLANAMRDLLPKKGEQSNMDRVLQELQADDERMKLKQSPK